MDLSNYIDVKQRLLLFYQKHPEGSIQFEFKGICEWNPEMIWGIAYAYRHPGDEKPGIGTAQELAIGRTGFSRGSEIQNLETSCWGRAIGSLSIGIEHGVATADEIAMHKDRQEKIDQWNAINQDEKERRTGSVTAKQADLITAMFAGNIAERDAYIELFKANNGIDDRKLNSWEASRLIDELKDLGKKPVYKDKRGTDDDGIKAE